MTRNQNITLVTQDIVVHDGSVPMIVDLSRRSAHVNTSLCGSVSRRPGGISAKLLFPRLPLEANAGLVSTDSHDLAITFQVCK